MNRLIRDEIESPIGKIVVASEGNTVVALDFDVDSRLETMRGRLERRFGTFEWNTSESNAGAVSALNDYLGGDVAALDRIEVDGGGTPFQREVWAELRRIPAGATVSYGELARRLGRPQAQRPVGGANNRNPIAIIVPCHRVVGADGSLTGYATGVDRKRWLLDHERCE